MGGCGSKRKRMHNRKQAYCREHGRETGRHRDRRNAEPLRVQADIERYETQNIVTQPGRGIIYEDATLETKDGGSAGKER